MGCVPAESFVVPCEMEGQDGFYSNLEFIENREKRIFWFFLSM